MNYDELYLNADLENGLPLGLTAAIAKQETGHIRDDNVRNRVSSPAGAIGRMQFMPATGRRYGMNSYADLTDPVKSINSAGRYLGDLYRQFGRPDLTAAAYNAGEHRQSLREGRIPNIPETQKYVKNVMRNLASSQHVAGMREKYSPGLFQQAAGGLFDAVMPAAQAADNPPPGNGVMNGAMYDASGLDAIANEPDDFALYDASGLDAIANEPPEQSGLSPTAQTAIRSTVKGLSAPLTMAADAVNAPVNLIAKGVNALRPGTMDYLPPTGQLVDRGLQAIGVDPRSSGTAENLVTAGLGAATGAGLSGIVGAMAPAGSTAASGLSALASAPGKQALSAMSASGASDMAREAGVGPVGQTVAGVAAGMVPGAAASTMRAVGSGAARIAAPFSAGGREKIAGRVLNKQASAPNTAAARAADPNFNRELVPGSRPTLAEVTQDPGLARLQRVLPSSQAALDAGIEQVNAARITQMDSAIRDTLDRVNKAPKSGGADVLDKIGLVKQRIGQTFEEQLQAKGIDPAELPVAPTKLQATLADLAKRHHGNAKLEKLIGETFRAVEGGTNFTRLWNNRQSLDDLIYENLLTATAGSKADMKRVGQQIRSAMNDDLIAAVPEFKPFLDRYSRMARAEGRLKLGRELVGKTENTARNIADEDQLYGDRTISGAKLDRLDIAGAERRAGAKLSKPQRAALAAAQEEKRRANVLTTGGAPVNSATAQNLAVNQIISDDILGGLLGDNTRRGLAGFAKNITQSTLGKVADAATRPAQVDVMRLIQQGLIDPQEGARLMNLGRLRSTQAFMPSLESGLKTGVLSEIYSRMAR